MWIRSLFSMKYRQWTIGKRYVSSANLKSGSTTTKFLHTISRYLSSVPQEHNSFDFIFYGTEKRFRHGVCKNIACKCAEGTYPLSLGNCLHFINKRVGPCWLLFKRVLATYFTHMSQMCHITILSTKQRVQCTLAYQRFINLRFWICVVHGLEHNCCTDWGLSL